MAKRAPQPRQKSRADKPPGKDTRFKPGQSGNPGGRQKNKTLRAYLLTQGDSLDLALMAIVNNPKHPKHFDAVKLALAYRDGKPKQQIGVDMGGARFRIVLGGAPVASPSDDEAVDE